MYVCPTVRKLTCLCLSSAAALLQGIAGLAQHVHDHEPASLLLCQLFNHRASARLGLHRPAAALDDALSSIRVKRTFARGYLRAATCYTKMGLLGAAAAVLDKVSGSGCAR
jgi:uncharacterized membrane-anchored protein